MVCMYVGIKICLRSSLQRIDCHEGAMINRRLYRTCRSVTVNRTETVTSSCRELSVAVSSIVLRNLVVHIVLLNPAVTGDEAFFQQMAAVGAFKRAKL